VAAVVARIGGVSAQLRDIAARMPSAEASAAIANRRLAEDAGSKDNRDPAQGSEDNAVQPELPFIDPSKDVNGRPMAGEEVRIEQDEVTVRQNPRDDGSLDLSRLKVPDFLLDRARATSEPANDRIEPSLDGSAPVPEASGFKASSGPKASRTLPEEPALKGPDIEPFPPVDREAPGETEAAPLVSVGPGPVLPPDAEVPEGRAAETESGLEPVIEPFTVPGRPATVIGTYNSGDNRYVMFSDGSIEAETPQGNFRFASLDELKAFIAAGGEGTPGPA
jgi:hypothetical protein